MKRRTRREINIEKVAGVLTYNQLTRFIINCDEQCGSTLSVMKHSGFDVEKGIISGSFMWFSTPEGEDYWADIYESIKSEYE